MPDSQEINITVNVSDTVPLSLYLELERLSKQALSKYREKTLRLEAEIEDREHTIEKCLSVMSYAQRVNLGIKEPM